MLIGQVGVADPGGQVSGVVALGELQRLAGDQVASGESAVDGQHVGEVREAFRRLGRVARRHGQIKDARRDPPIELGLGEESKKASLVGRLKGSAAAWAQGMAEELYVLSYQDMKQALLDHF